MITICRAEDGQMYQVNASVRDIEITGSLELFLHQEIGIDEAAAIAFLSDGRRLTSSNIRELGAVQDGTIFVFNKDYIDHNVEDVMKLLHVEPTFQPSVDDATTITPLMRHAQLATSYARTAHKHHESVQHHLQSLTFQNQALYVASKSLDYSVLAVSESFHGIAVNARRELEKQATLLSGVDPDLDLISQVAVHVEFCSEAVRRSIEAGDPQRVLGDYVSKQKMQTVKDTCARTHEELLRRFNELEVAVGNVKEGADAVRATIENTGIFDQANACVRKSQELRDRIVDAAAHLEGSTADADSLLIDLKRLDDAHRHELQQIVNKKNVYTHQCLTVLRHITHLNNELVRLPAALVALSEGFRLKTNFSHLHRLHNMLYAYCATVIEIVRRKEFTRFFYQRVQSILEVMAKLSSSERKRRQVYRSEIQGLLPFETHGMDDPVPTVDFSPNRANEIIYPFERLDVDELMQLLKDLEAYAQTKSRNSPVALNSVGACRSSLERLISKMDDLEVGFDKIAERSLLSQSRLSSSRRRSIQEERANQGLTQELQAIKEARSQETLAFKEERSSLQAEIQQLRSELDERDSKVSNVQDRSTEFQRELQRARAELESERAARRKLEDRNGELSADISLQRKEISKALSNATEHAKEAEMSRQELTRVREEFEEVKALEQRNGDKVVHLLEDQANTLRNLEEARARGEDLEHQIHAAREESQDVHQALKEARMEKDRLLRAQASEHDRIIRDHLAEADGDRAVLDRQFAELQNLLESKRLELKAVRGDLEIANADASGLREELQRVERELHEVRHVERLLRDDLKAGRVSQHDYEQRIENSNRLIAQILDVAIHFRSSHSKVLHAAQMLGSHANSTRHGSNNVLDLAFSPTSLRHSIILQHEEPSPIDPDDPSGALEILREFDHDHFLETVTKTIRKWQKQCKEYRERSKGKISFRNFAKGDLALFLPTRNSLSKPWAAFNVSFPHYFLQANGHLAEQLKTREWIVARITSISEHVVDQKDPTSNPYGLGDGVKYYMLEVEDWTQPSHSKRRVSSKKFPTDGHDAKEPGVVTPSKLSPSSLPPGPPEPEVEDTFMVTHPPNSHLFPTRTRSNSSPAARPSSLSRLLAQASPTTEGVSVLIPEKPPSPQPAAPAIIHESPPTLPSLLPDQTPSPPSETPNPRNILSNGHIANGNSGNISNLLSNLPPLRPVSRSSRLSNASRFSVVRVPTLGIVAGSQPKAAATTALSEQTLATSSNGSAESNPFGSPTTSSPHESITEAMTSVIGKTSTIRRRTASHQAPRRLPSYSSSSQSTVVASPALPGATPAATTLANLANSWGVAFGRKNKARGVLTPPVESSNAAASAGVINNNNNSSAPQHDGGSGGSGNSARELLKRF